MPFFGGAYYRNFAVFRKPTAIAYILGDPEPCFVVVIVVVVVLFFTV